MKKNEYFGFDEDFEICAIHVWSEAKERMDEAAREEARRAARVESIRLIEEKIDKFFAYLGCGDPNHCAAAGSVWEYVKPSYAASQIIKSCENARVPRDLLEDAAKVHIQHTREGKVKEILEIVLTKIKDEYAVADSYSMDEITIED